MVSAVCAYWSIISGSDVCKYSKRGKGGRHFLMREKQICRYKQKTENRKEKQDTPNQLGHSKCDEIAGA